jgi:ribosome recycling factor
MRLAGGRANPKMVDEILLEKFGQKKTPNPVK